MQYDQFKNDFQKSINEDGVTVVQLDDEDVDGFVAWAGKHFLVEKVQRSNGTSLPSAVFLKNA